MNLEEMKRKHAALISEAKTIVEKSGDSLSHEDYDRVKELKSQADALAKEIADAQEQVDLVAEISAAKAAGDEAAKTTGGASDDTVGGHFVKSAQRALKNFRPGEHLVAQATEFKAAGDPQLTTDFPNTTDHFRTEFVRGIVNQRRERLVAADLMGSARLSKPVIKYLVEKVQRIADGGPTTVAEGTAKPYVRYSDFDVVTETPAKIAVLNKLSDEMIEDEPFIRDWIDQQLVYDLSVEEEKQLLVGDGTGANLKGLFKREGLQVLDIGTGDPFDGLLEAISKVALATPLTADAVLLNPADYLDLRRKKDTNGQYLAGGPFQGSYGQGGIILNPSIWGLKVIDTPAVEKGKYMVGAFRQGATVLRRGGIRVDATNTNVDDFEKNLVTLRAEERLGLMVPRPAAFVTGTINSASTTAVSA